MSTIICPHCGFNNFSISAYCSNCERPLQGDPKAAGQQRQAPRPPPAKGSLPPASQVAQQILQRRPPVPTAPTAAPLPSAAEVAHQLMQKRAHADDIATEPTVIARVPVELQRALVAERAPLPARPTRQAPARPPLRPTDTSIHDDPTIGGPQPRAVQIDRTEVSAERTMVFAAPTFEQRAEHAPVRTGSSSVTQPVATSLTNQPARPAAAPSLPQPIAARDVLPTAREPAPRPAARKAPTEPMLPAFDSPRTEPGTRVDATRPEAPFLRTEPGIPASVLRRGATPPQRTAPRPPTAAATGALEYAAGWRILLGHVVDIGLLVGLFTLLVNLDAALTGPRGLDAHGKAFEFLANHPGSSLRAFILTLLAGTAYHLVLNERSGRTLGRFVAGTTLARRSGRPMSWPIVVIRTVASYVSLLAFGAGFFWSIVDSRGRAFHDLITGTMVVRHRATR